MKAYFDLNGMEGNFEMNYENVKKAENIINDYNHDFYDYHLKVYCEDGKVIVCAEAEEI